MSATVELWLAYYSDFSDAVIFTDELAAYRYAVEHSMQVQRVEQGTSLRDQTTRR